MHDGGFSLMISLASTIVLFFRYAYLLFITSKCQLKEKSSLNTSLSELYLRHPILEASDKAYMTYGVKIGRIDWNRHGGGTERRSHRNTEVGADCIDS